ncbi:MAG: electron transport complex subunit RsxC, partial [Pirellulaceae bacterium]|nr:electron transport complex subunit RsxC [Pirellulaceae bacterium]
EHKSLASDQAIEVFPSPAEVRIALLHHLGAPCEPTRKTRDEVNVGDVVGEAAGFVSAPVHASLKGTIGRAGMTTLPNGRHVPVVLVKAADEQPLAGQALWDDLFAGPWTAGLDADSRDPADIAKAARDAGLVGLGGAAFPTHVKLARNEKKPIHTLLLNGCECEPYLAADYRLMIEAPEPIVAGALLAQRAIGAKNLEIAIEDNKPLAIERLREAAKGTNIVVRQLKTKYPQGGEKQLIYAALQTEVPLGGLPLDVGVVVMNVGTAATLAQAVLRGKPLTHRVVTVSGGGIRQPKNLLVPIGVSYGELIEFCGGLTDDAARVVAGGPMMGFSISDLRSPVTKGTSGITVMTRREIEQARETACVRCGRCVQVCPMNLVPAKLAQAVRADNVELLDTYHITACMECGSCAYVCPASLPLVQLLRLGKVKKSKK